MNLNLPNSAIWFVVTLLALSGTTVATAADVNADPEAPVNTARQSDKEPLYLSLNHFPSITVTDLGEQFNVPKAYDEEFLESLQEKLSAELDTRIDLQAF
jgi:hypothetical protein